MDRVRIAAHAKLNLLLRILAREAPAGYHQIETAFALLELADELVVTRTAAGEVSVRVNGKRIPVQAGLGGGSSDAAAALHAVNALAGNVVPRHELLHFATRLGADVAFFASGAPAALAWGRGERLFRLPAPPAAPALVALALPPLAVATPDAYGWWDDMHPEPAARGPLLLDADAFTGWGGIGRLGGNAVAAVYANAALRDDAAMVLGEKHQRLIKTATRSVPAPGPEAA